MADISSITLPDGVTYNLKDSNSGYITGMTILSYGSSTWADFLAAYNAKRVVYCRASSNSNPASGSQTRLAFMAYVNNATNPTSVEFQYYRSVNGHSATQQGDQVYVYTLTSANKWTVTVRESYTKIVAGTNMSSSYSGGTLTLNFNGSIPSTAADVGAIAVPSSASSGDVLAYNGTAWVAQAPSGGLSADVKTALLNCFRKVTWADGDGETYYRTLHNALLPNSPYITAVYSASLPICVYDTVDSLKDNLVVTYYANASATGVILNSTDYTLSGSLTVGTSIITVTYNDCITDFSAVVSAINQFDYTRFGTSEYSVTMSRGNSSTGAAYWTSETNGSSLIGASTGSNSPLARGNASQITLTIYPIRVPSGATRIIADSSSTSSSNRPNLLVWDENITNKWRTITPDGWGTHKEVVLSDYSTYEGPYYITLSVGGGSATVDDSDWVFGWI